MLNKEIFTSGAIFGEFTIIEVFLGLKLLCCLSTRKTYLMILESIIWEEMPPYTPNTGRVHLFLSGKSLDMSTTTINNGGGHLQENADKL